MVRGVEDGAHSHRYNIFLCNTNLKPNREKRYIDILMEKGVDGIILEISQGANEEYVDSVLKNKIPIVLIDEPVKNKNAYNVFTDNFKGGYIATKHLIDLGHKKIACFTGPYSNLTSIERLRGYKKAFKDAGLPIEQDIIMQGLYNKETGYILMSEIIKSFKNITAIFAANDSIAMGVYKSIKEHGFRIPLDYSVVGFDDVYDMQLIEPPLTDISQSSYEMGIKAVEMLAKILRGIKPRKKVIVLEPELIIRKSTRKIQ